MEIKQTITVPAPRESGLGDVEFTTTNWTPEFVEYLVVRGLKENMTNAWSANGADAEREAKLKALQGRIESMRKSEVGSFGSGGGRLPAWVPEARDLAIAAGLVKRGKEANSIVDDKTFKVAAGKRYANLKAAAESIAKAKAEAVTDAPEADVE